MGYNLAQIRAAISPLAFQGAATTAQQNTAINRARQRIYNTTVGGGWKGGDVTANLAVVSDVAGTSQFVTLPFGIDSIVGVYGTNGDYEIQNEWFDFTRSAPNQTATPAGDVLTDLGSGFVTFIDIPSTGLQPIFAVQSAATITLIGLDMNGNDVAETINCPIAGTYTATNTYSDISSLELTSGLLPPPTIPLPTSDPGIPGAYWNDGGTLAISGPPTPGAPLPIADPHIAGAFWNDGGQVAISAG